MKWLVSFFFSMILNIAFTQPAKDRASVAAYNELFGVTFPELLLQDTSGNLFNTASLQGKTIYVDFWFTTCPPCLKQLSHAKALKQHFEKDTSVVFLNICIENIERKDAWKQMIADKQIDGINLFYARNRPQKVNLLRQYRVNDFPTYMLVSSDHKIIGHNAPAPSEKYWVHWAIDKAKQNISLALILNRTLWLL
jgi:thiol-disulfide isomerase/thioredoxin